MPPQISGMRLEIDRLPFRKSPEVKHNDREDFPEVTHVGERKQSHSAERPRRGPSRHVSIASFGRIKFWAVEVDLTGQRGWETRPEHRPARLSMSREMRAAAVPLQMAIEVDAPWPAVHRRTN